LKVCEIERIGISKILKLYSNENLRAHNFFLMKNLAPKACFREIRNIKGDAVKRQAANAVASPGISMHERNWPHRGGTARVKNHRTRSPSRRVRSGTIGRDSPTSRRLRRRPANRRAARWLIHGRGLM